MIGFKPFNLNKLPTFTERMEDFILTEKLVRRNNNRKTNFADFSDKIDPSTQGGKGQTAFIANLALNGFGCHTNLVDAKNIDPTISKMDNSRFLLAMYENVSKTFERKYVKRYKELLEPLREAHLPIFNDLCSKPLSSVISTSFDFFNQSSFCSMDSKVDSLGVIIGGDGGYTYTRFDLRTLSSDFGFWLSHFIDQLSIAGVGFNTPSKLFDTSELSLLDDYLPEIEDRNVIFNPRLLELATSVLEQMESDEERYDFISSAFINCLQFKTEFDGNKQEIVEWFSHALNNTIEYIESDLDMLIGGVELCKSISEYYNVDPELDILRSGFDVMPNISGLPNLSGKCVTSNLKAILKCAPKATTTVEASILECFKGTLELASETHFSDIKSDELSTREGRFIHTDLTGREGSINDLIANYETQTLMQINMGSFTGVEEFDHNDLSNIIESEALSAALLNALFCLMNKTDDHISNVF
ncbi:hypothetical protein [Vibrio sp. 10N.239.312.D08]|uniref:hypothetical protein n=1 Tax=Vibrio sp. 10N.239.312.D08 TaxID=3229978 RepID=UPI0035546891